MQDHIRSQLMKLSIVLSTQPASFAAVAFKGDFEANLTKIAGWGYDGVELAIRDPSLVDADELERILAIHRLRVPAIGTGQAWGEERLSFTSDDLSVRIAAVERVIKHIPLAKRLNALIIIGLIRGITPTGSTHVQSMGFIINSLQECCALAQNQGVRLVLEPINRYETDLIHNVVEGMSLLEQVGYSNLGLLLDTFHMNIEEKSIDESIRLCGKHIFHFHVADSNRWHPGAGHLDFTSILETLVSTGYEGFISGEFMPQPDADTSARQNIAFLRQLEQSIKGPKR
jgi:sugar phosphate isomerase/epimerase